MTSGGMNHLTPEQRLIASQRERIEEIEEELRQAKELAAPFLVFPREWGLRPSGRKLLAALYVAQSGFRTREQLLEHIVTRSESGDLAILRTQMWHLRQALIPFSINVEKRWGLGYELPRESREKITVALQRRVA